MYNFCDVLLSVVRETDKVSPRISKQYVELESRLACRKRVSNAPETKLSPCCRRGINLPRDGRLKSRAASTSWDPMAGCGLRCVCESTPPFHSRYFHPTPELGKVENQALHAYIFANLDFREVLSCG